MSDIKRNLEIMWNGRDSDDVDATLAAHDRILDMATAADVPMITGYLEREGNYCWLRELLMIQLLLLGGVDHLEKAFSMLQQNEQEGHSSAILTTEISGFVEHNADTYRPALTKIISDSQSPFHEEAEWLLEYCNQ
ncbi:hypothetical protein NT6N_24300 [Oceaniferula spumae]|uniref:Immunity protein 30 domain-containing protein n=1 Tax=Oceaniferula spumae TaxID=2979115 RepID=A0AAT9FMZ7_9BACT